MESLFQASAELEAKNEAGVLCTIVRSQGSTPRHSASKMLVYADGHTLGTIGGGAMESRVISEALQALQDGKTRLLQYNMSEPSRGDPGVCGGQVEIFVEPILPKQTLVVIGAGHVGKAVAHLAAWLGFRVAVSDDRPEFCSPESVPEAQEFFPLPIQELVQNLKITPWTYLVLTTRSVDLDVQGLPALLESPAAFIGVIGSQRRWSVTRQKLLELGHSEEQLARVRSPVGLEIQAETPEEIAVSILAEIIQVRNAAGARHAA